MTGAPGEPAGSSARSLAGGGREGGGRGSRTPLLVAGGVAAAAVIALGGWWLFGQDDDDGEPQAGDQQGEEEQGEEEQGQEDEQGEDQQQGDEQQQEEEQEPQLAADEECTEEITANDRWVCIASASVTDGQLVIEYDAEWAGEEPNIDGGFHVHFYGADESGVNPAASTMGSHADPSGDWYIEDQNPSERALEGSVATAIGDAPKVCARIADGGHALVPDADGTFNTGNCWPIARAE